MMSMMEDVRHELQDAERQLLTHLRLLRRNLWRESEALLAPQGLTLGQRVRRHRRRHHGVLAVHHHPVGDPGPVDHAERHRLRAAMGSLPLHPPEPGAVVPGRLCRALHHDEPEPPAGQDRKAAEEDHRVNIKAELEIELLHQKVDNLREKELLLLTQSLRELIEELRTTRTAAGKS